MPPLISRPSSSFGRLCLRVSLPSCFPLICSSQFLHSLLLILPPFLSQLIDLASNQREIESHQMANPSLLAIGSTYSLSYVYLFPLPSEFRGENSPTYFKCRFTSYMDCKPQLGTSIYQLSSLPRATFPCFVERILPGKIKFGLIVIFFCKRMENEVIMLFSGIFFKNIKFVFLEVIPRIKTFVVVLVLV